MRKGWGCELVLLTLGGSGCTLPRYEPAPLDAASGVQEFSTRTLTSPEFLAFARAHWPFAEEFPSPPRGLEALTLAGFFHRRELGVARAALAGARAAEASAAQRPNPTLTFDPEVVPGNPEPWILGFQLDVPIETAGKRGLRSRAAEERTRAAEIELYASAWRVRSEVRATLVEYLAARAERGALDGLSEAREAQRALLAAQLAAGRIGRLELAEVERELAGLALERASLATRTASARAALASALGVPSAALEGIELADELLFELPSAPAAVAARDLGLPSRLDLRAGLSEYSVAEAELALEIARAIPDLHLGPGYHWDQGDHKFLLGLALELPLFHQNEGPIAEAHAARTAAEARFLARQESAIGAIEQARVAYAGTLQEVEAARQGLVEARAREARVVRTLEAGAGDRPGVIGARVARLELERELGLRAAQAARALGALEDELQRPLGEPFEPAPIVEQGERGT